MVTGLDLFREKFSAHQNAYALIGGTACDIVMNRAGLPFRATKDLDIVLILESSNPEFAEAFWEFIQAGKYESKQKSTGENQHYRFQNPASRQYPYMLELFSRKPGHLPLAADSHLTPIHVDDDVSSLSAILLNDEYYDFLRAGVEIIDDMPVVNAEHLIPLKARAWLDLHQQKSDGAAIDSNKIKKHKNDVFRLYQIIDPTFRANLQGLLLEDMRRFLDAMLSEQIDLKAFGIRNTDIKTVLNELEAIYL